MLLSVAGGLRLQAQIAAVKRRLALHLCLLGADSIHALQQPLAGCIALGFELLLAALELSGELLLCRPQALLAGGVHLLQFGLVLL